MASPFCTPTKVQRLTGPSTESSAVKIPTLDNLEKVCDELEYSYVQHIGGGRSLLEMSPPQTKAAAMLLAKGEVLVKQQLGQMKTNICTLRQTLSAKEKSIKFLQQELANCQTAAFAADKEEETEKSVEQCQKSDEPEDKSEKKSAD